MRNIQFIFISMLSVSLLGCNSESSFGNKEGNTQVSVHLKGNTDGFFVVEKQKIGDAEVLDTLKFDKNGKASLFLNLEKIEIITIKKSEQEQLVFVANKGDKISVTADADSLSGSFRLAGTPENEDLDAFILKERAYQNFKDSLAAIYVPLQKRQMHYQVEELFNELYKERSILREKYVQDFIDADPDRFINLLAVSSLDIKRNPDYYKLVKEHLEMNFPASEHVLYFSKKVNKILPSNIGGIAPEFSLLSVENKQVNLSDFKGKYVLLDFWATWCKNCIAEIPNLKNAHQKFSGDDFEVVSICVDRAVSKPTWKRIIKQYQTNWPQLYDSTGKTAEAYGIEFFPTIFLLDKNGEIIAKNLRGAEIEKMLNKKMFNK